MHTLLLQSLVPLLLITCFLWINVELSFCADDAQYANCSNNITCGGNTDISYPFWGVNRADYCGEPGFKVQCQNNVPVINMSNIIYRILEMNSTNPRSVQLAREDYWESICPLAFVNTTLDFSLFNYASSGSVNVSFFYQCNLPSTISSLATCTISNTATPVYYFTQRSSGDLSSYMGCTHQVIVPVSTTAAVAIETNQGTVTDAVDEGFPLQVEIDNAQCDGCVESGGICGYNNSTAAGGFLCLCKDKPYPDICNGTALTTSGSSGGFMSRDWRIGISAGVSGPIIMILCIICIQRKKLLVFFRKDKRDEFDIEAFLKNYGSLTPKRYSYSNVKKITNSFKHKIGKGGYGTVYKGRLPDGLLVAVKVLSESKGNGEEFVNEVASIGRTSHVNIVTLIGFCYEGDKRALIYEFMPNGSLDNFICKQGPLNASSRLEWKTLSEIAVGIARGLEYLHRGCNTRILHFDIKPQNILLDKDFCPKVADFGLAKLCKTKESIVSMMGTRGTAGYIAPEVFSRNFGGVSHKSDVYSYGMLVLEMVGARKNSDSGVSHMSEMFPYYVYKDLELDNDENVFGAISEEEKEIARKMVLISLWCIQTIPSDRPSMSKVVEMLEGPLHSLQIAPKPLLFSPAIAAEDSMSTSQQSETGEGTAL